MKPRFCVPPNHPEEQSFVWEPLWSPRVWGLSMLPSWTLLEGGGDRPDSGTLGSTDTGLGSHLIKDQDLPVCFFLPEYLPVPGTHVPASPHLPLSPVKAPVPTPCSVREMATTQNQAGVPRLSRVLVLHVKSFKPLFLKNLLPLAAFEEEGEGPTFTPSLPRVATGLYLPQPSAWWWGFRCPSHRAIISVRTDGKWHSSVSLWPGQKLRGSALGGQGPVLGSALTAAVLFLRCLQDGVGDVGFVRHMTVSGKCWAEEESRASHPGQRN